MPLTLQNIKTDTVGVVASYEISHSTPGREGTVLTAPLTLSIGRDKTWCALAVNDCAAATPDEAITKLATWLRRLADGLEKRAGTVQLPF